MSLTRDFKPLLIVASLLGTGLIFGCGVSQAEGKKITMQKAGQTGSTEIANKGSSKNKLERISSVSFDGVQISFSVISTGCTGAENFTVEHQVVDGVCRVQVTRNMPDMCRRAPFIADVKLDWTQPELCIDLPVVIDNPVLVTPVDGFLQKRMK